MTKRVEALRARCRRLAQELGRIDDLQSISSLQWVALLLLLQAKQRLPPKEITALTFSPSVQGELAEKATPGVQMSVKSPLYEWRRGKGCGVSGITARDPDLTELLLHVLEHAVVLDNSDVKPRAEFVANLT